MTGSSAPEPRSVGHHGQTGSSPPRKRDLHSPYRSGPPRTGPRPGRETSPAVPRPAPHTSKTPSHVYRDLREPRALLPAGPRAGGLRHAHRHVPPGLRLLQPARRPRPGAAGFIEAEKKHLDAFPGIRLTVTHTVAEADKVGAFVVVEGDQAGEYCGAPPQGAHVRFSMFNLFTIKDGKIIEKRAEYDLLDTIEQLWYGSAA
ncbi:ester cyclase [Streptomyces sp. S1D4-11]